MRLELALRTALRLARDMAEYRFSHDPLEMDRPLIHTWLSEQSYWAIDRPREVQERAMDASLNFGMFDTDTGAQVAFARVVTDSATFAWLCDVFVAEHARGHGVGVALIRGVRAALEPLDLRLTLLATKDAHGLYAKFGFEPLETPSKWMSRQG